MQIPKVQKAARVDCLFLGSACVKDARKMLVKLTLGLFCTAFLFVPLSSQSRELLMKSFCSASPKKTLFFDGKIAK
jgi:hypothetical protein